MGFFQQLGAPLFQILLRFFLSLLRFLGVLLPFAVVGRLLLLMAAPYLLRLFPPLPLLPLDALLLAA
jgi:hypothetical protein